MEILQSSGFAALLIFIINVIFMAGVYFGKIKTFASKLEVEQMLKERVDKEVKKALENHCPFADKLKNLDDINIEKIIDRRIELHPIIQKYQLIDYAIQDMKPDVKQIKEDVQNIKISLAKLNGT